MEQFVMLPVIMDGEDYRELQEQVTKLRDYQKVKRSWENAFQKWSDEHGMEQDNTTSYGCCGYGSMCDYCEDNSYGRPCVRALNKMCHEKRITVDYTDRDFSKIWLS